MSVSYFGIFHITFSFSFQHLEKRGREGQKLGFDDPDEVSMFIKFGKLGRGELAVGGEWLLLHFLDLLTEVGE